MRKAFVIKLKPGTKVEYKRRHDNIWPEISKINTALGMKNYSIWFYEDLLFAYFEIDKKKPLTLEEEQIVKRWSKYMSDIISIVTDPETGEPVMLEMMYLHE